MLSNPATNNNCPVKGSETDAEDSSEKGNIEKEWTGGIELKSNVCPRPNFQNRLWFWALIGLNRKPLKTINRKAIITYLFDFLISQYFERFYLIY